MVSAAAPGVEVEEEEHEEQTVEAAQRRMNAADEDGDDDGEDVEDSLKESISGSVKVRKLLENAGIIESGGPNKKQKVDHLRPAHRLKIQQCAAKWGLQNDPAVLYVIEQLKPEVLKQLFESNYMPDKHNIQNKTPADLLNRHLSEVKERSLPGGGPLDAISVFKFRWKLQETEVLLLRKLNHKDVLHILNNYDGTKPVPEMIEQAGAAEPDYEGGSSAVPDGPGATTVGRFMRLELIDPVADACIFGDANLTFAIKLAIHRKVLGHVGRTISTTFENAETLRERYNEIDKTIADLEENYFSEVWHEVDCTRIATHKQFEGYEGAFGAVYYNFPHSGAVRGFFDGHPFVRWRHENLMHLFFRALTKYMKPGGVVKVASNMSAVGVRYSDIVTGAERSEFDHAETFPFTDWALHRYGRSYGDRRDAHKRPGEGENYNAQKQSMDMVYCFRYAPTGKKMQPPHFTCPPAKSVLASSTEGPLGNYHGENKNRAVEELYTRFLNEVQGVHVG